MEHCCLVYFLIRHDNTFDLKEFCRIFSLNEAEYEPYLTEEFFEFNRNEYYDVDLNKMVRLTLSPFFGKEEELLRLKKEWNLRFVLERVPGIAKDSEEPHPILSLDQDILAFLAKTGTVDDLDYYIL